MSDDTKRVLEMVSEGKVSVDEAERLLSALAGPNEPGAGGAPPVAPRKGGGRYLRVVVAEEGAEKVNVRVPIKLIRAGMKFQALLPDQAREQIDKALGEKGLDPKKLKPEMIEELVDALDDLVIDVADDKDTKVRVFCE